MHTQRVTSIDRRSNGCQPLALEAMKTASSELVKAADICTLTKDAHKENGSRTTHQNHFDHRLP
eukprot:6227131-Amphidinium_carterae.1